MRLYPLDSEVRSSSHHAKSGLRNEQAKCRTRALRIPDTRSGHPYIRETNSSAMISKLVAAVSRHILDGDDLIALKGLRHSLRDIEELSLRWVIPSGRPEPLPEISSTSWSLLNEVTCSKVLQCQFCRVQSHFTPVSQHINTKILEDCLQALVHVRLERSSLHSYILYTSCGLAQLDWMKENLTGSSSAEKRECNHTASSWGDG